jgi:intergrase/recombinase
VRSRQDQQYIDRLKDKIADYHEREKAQLAYSRQLIRHCLKHGIGYPVPKHIGEAMLGAIDKFNSRN